LGLAILFASLTHIILIGGGLLYSHLSQEKLPEPKRIVRIKSVADLGAPPSISRSAARALAVAAPQAAAPTVGIPKAVPDEEATDNVTIATQQELAQILDSPTSTGLEGIGGGESLVVEVDPEDLFPEPDEFIPYDEPPVPISTVKPDYPELAKQAGIEGVVWVQALVDKKGKVRKAQIYKASGANAGFEEAAVEAAMKTEYKPAISNKQPLSVWVVYKVEFTLKGIR
jgi:protein TonB